MENNLYPATSKATPIKALSREEEAKQALENTVISPAVARTLTVIFLVTISSVPIIQTVVSLRRQEPVLPSIASNSTLPEGEDLKRFETDLEADSVVGKSVLPHVQNVLTRLGVGTESAYLGRGGWLGYRPDFNYVTGAGFLDSGELSRRALQKEGDTPVQGDPLPAILRFKSQLDKRHIRLILLPTPLKPMLEPGRFVKSYGNLTAPLQNPSYREFVRKMRENQVLVCDPTTALFQREQQSGEPQFLRTDTHWTPGGMQTTADILARFINRFSTLPPQRTAYRKRQVNVSSPGDLAQMLKLPEARSKSLFPPETVGLNEVLTSEGEPWRASTKANVMLLGDSFTNIFSRDAMGWGTGAGLAEQLSYRLQRPVDVIGINAGGSFATRRRLREELLREPERLRNTRVIVWQFAMRDFQSGNWQSIDLPPEVTQKASASPTVSGSSYGIPLLPSSKATVARFRKALTEKVNQVEQAAETPAQAMIFDGARGWMFYQSDARYVTKRPFLQPKDNPQIDALLDFKRQLARRGITLLVMPVPAKATIYPEMLGLGEVPLPQGPQNPSFGRYRKELQAQGIEVFDPTGTLLRQKSRIHSPLYMPTDSHWTFTGMENTAATLAAQIRAQLLELSAVGYTRQPQQVANVTDISYMLQRQSGQPQGMLLQQTVQQVLTPSGEVWKPAADADILVMGDSFANIYSRGGEWGKGAGFAEQLSYHLQRPVDLIAMDSGGVNGTRRALQREMQQGRDRLAGKKIVIYEFASRFLLRRNWEKIQLPTVSQQATNPSGPTATVPNGDITVQATIKERSLVPNAASTPYPDLVISLQLTDVQVVGQKPPASAAMQDIVVYTWGLRKALPARAAQWKVGQTVTLKLTPWRKVETNYGSYNRTELPGDKGARLTPYWVIEDK